MKNKSGIPVLLLVTILSLFHLAMARHAQYDEEARQAEREERLKHKEEKQGHHPVRNFAEGVKQATVDNTADLISETAESSREGAPVVGTLEGARKSTGKILDNTVKGVSKVATLGYGEVDNYEVVEPKKDSEETTTIKIKIPGT